LNIVPGKSARALFKMLTSGHSLLTRDRAQLLANRQQTYPIKSGQMVGHLAAFSRQFCGTLVFRNELWEVVMTSLLSFTLPSLLTTVVAPQQQRQIVLAEKFSISAAVRSLAVAATKLFGNCGKSQSKSVSYSMTSFYLLLSTRPSILSTYFLTYQTTTLLSPVLQGHQPVKI
jgi:hypothetical protein